MTTIAEYLKLVADMRTVMSCNIDIFHIHPFFHATYPITHDELCGYMDRGCTDECLDRAMRVITRIHKKAERLINYLGGDMEHVGLN